MELGWVTERTWLYAWPTDWALRRAEELSADSRSITAITLGPQEHCALKPSPALAPFWKKTNPSSGVRLGEVSISVWGLRADAGPVARPPLVFRFPYSMATRGSGCPGARLPQPFHKCPVGPNLLLSWCPRRPVKGCPSPHLALSPLLPQLPSRRGLTLGL